MMNRKFLLPFISCFSFVLVGLPGIRAQVNHDQHLSKIKWMTFEQVTTVTKSSKTPKKIIVDLFTDKCGYCKKMDLSTFQNEFISHYMNENFYPVKFNAETKSDIQFNDQVFHLDRSGFHELAIDLSMGDLVFPTLVFLDEENQIIQPIQGYQTVDDLERIMVYFANDFYKNTPWNEFTRRYKPTNSRPVIDVNPNGETVKKKN